MSLETWMKEYYVPAEECTGSDVEKIEQELRKWVGVYEENLKKHGVKLNDLPLGATDCACCISQWCTECLFWFFFGRGCVEFGYDLAVNGKPVKLLDDLALMMHKVMEKEMGVKLDIWPEDI